MIFVAAECLETSLNVTRGTRTVLSEECLPGATSLVSSSAFGAFRFVDRRFLSLLEDSADRFERLLMFTIDSDSFSWESKFNTKIDDQKILDVKIRMCGSVFTHLRSWRMQHPKFSLKVACQWILAKINKNTHVLKINLQSFD